jgi:hypothetical protein
MTGVATPRGKSPHPFLKERHEVSVLAVLIAREDSHIILASAIRSVAVVGNEVGSLLHEMLTVKQVEKVIVQHTAKRGLTPIVTVVGIEGDFVIGFCRHCEDIAIFENVETNELDPVVDKVFTRIKGFVIVLCH